jgi:hypothetical protein
MEKAARLRAASHTSVALGTCTQRSDQSLPLESINIMLEGQTNFRYTDEDLAAFEKYVSSERLAAYITYARGDKWVAVRLYERNTELSEALYGVLQALEVTLRNAIHLLMSKKLGRDDWYESFAFGKSERAEVEDAKRKITERPAPLTPGRVVAELGFGFWVRLFSYTYDKTLWVPYLRTILPLRFDGTRTYIHGRLVDLKTLRNRIAHHERITCGKRDTQKDYLEILETVSWLSRPMRLWVESTNCLPERLARRIPKRSKADTAISTALPDA